MKKTVSGIIWRWIPLALVLLLLPCGRAPAGELWQVERMVSEPVFGGNMLVREAGRQNDKMVLLVHGLGEEAGTTWNGVVGGLSREYHVVAPDLPGFGQSSKANKLYSPQAYAEVLNNLVISLPAKPLYLVGHSLGGAISLIYAAQYGQDLKRLILVDSVGCLHRLAVSQDFIKQQIHLDIPFVPSQIESSLDRISDFLLEKTSRIGLDPERILDSETMRAKFLAGEPPRIAAFALVLTDYSLVLGHIKTPTWLLWGELDQVASLRVAKTLQWMLPDSQLQMLQGRGHSPMLEDARRFLPELIMSLDSEPHRPSTALLRDNAADGYYEHEEGRVFQGTYRTLRIDHCKNVRLIDITAQNLEIADSQVEIEGCRIETAGEEPGIHVVRSRLTVTGADIHAETGIITEMSRLDLAGVRFIETREAIRADGAPSELLSSSSVKQFGGTNTSIQINRSLISGQAL